MTRLVNAANKAESAARAAQRAQAEREDAGLLRSSSFCTGASESLEALGVPPLKLVPKSFTTGWLPWFAGIFVTALFVSFGAQFWFDALGRLVKLRSMGQWRRDGEADAAGRGASPLSATDAASPTTTSPPGGSGAGEPFSDARNEFERSLLPAEIVAVQQARGVKPESGRLDQPTRAAIERFTREQGQAPTDELSNALFQQITGRAPQSRPVTPSGRHIVVGQSHPFAPYLSGRLMDLMDFPDRLSKSITDSVFGFEGRALAVLFRYKRDAAATPPARDVARLARESPTSLDEIDELLQLAIQTAVPGDPTLVRDPDAPWLDWAIGELGQQERDSTRRGDSNPRICEYLDLADPPTGGDAGDHTPWCGAFAAWVVLRHNAHLTALSPPPRPPWLAPRKPLDNPLALSATAGGPLRSPLKAEHWEYWGRPGTLSTPRTASDFPRGAVLLSNFNGKADIEHVGFCLGASGQRVWMIGGNQANGTRVSIIEIDMTAIRGVRLPDPRC